MNIVAIGEVVTRSTLKRIDREIEAVETVIDLIGRYRTRYGVGDETEDSKALARI
jgi:hypothetical protein